MFGVSSLLYADDAALLAASQPRWSSSSKSKDNVNGSLQIGFMPWGWSWRPTVGSSAVMRASLRSVTVKEEQSWKAKISVFWFVQTLTCGHEVSLKRVSWSGSSQMIIRWLGHLLDGSSGGFSGTSPLEETLWQTQNSFMRYYVLLGLGTP